MKLIVISTIRNEADILETFVRYHLQFVDRMIIINHRSVDASASILEQLQKEGLPLDVMDEQRLDHQQGQILTRIMKKAVDDYNADWIVPLDADEFMVSTDQMSIREIIAELPQDKIAKVAWRTYVPLPSDDSGELNILKRIQHHCRIENNNLRKIMIPRSIALKKNGFIAAGNHGFVRQVLRKQKDFPYVNSDQLALAHFPVRSGDQIMTKAFVGWLACLAKPNKLPDENYHLKLFFDRFKRGALISPEELTSLAMSYAQPGKPSFLIKRDTAGVPVNRHGDDDFVNMPVVPKGEHFGLSYTGSSKTEPVRVLASLAEEYAEALAVVGRREGRRISAERKYLTSLFRFWQ